MQAFSGIRNHWRKVRLTYCFCFLIVCVFIRCLIFSEGCWWRARRISSIINHLKEVGPAFFFLCIFIFALTHCFACLFRRVFFVPWDGKASGQFSASGNTGERYGYVLLCFFSNNFYSVSFYHFRSVAFSEVFFVAPVIDDFQYH